jgi:hypothetical protein
VTSAYSNLAPVELLAVEFFCLGSLVSLILLCHSLLLTPNSQAELGGQLAGPSLANPETVGPTSSHFWELCSQKTTPKIYIKSLKGGRDLARATPAAPGNLLLGQNLPSNTHFLTSSASHHISETSKLDVDLFIFKHSKKPADRTISYNLL